MRRNVTVRAAMLAALATSAVGCATVATGDATVTAPTVAPPSPTGPAGPSHRAPTTTIAPVTFAPVTSTLPTIAAAPAEPPTTPPLDDTTREGVGAPSGYLPVIVPPVARIAVMGDSVFADRLQPGVASFLRVALAETSSFESTSVENLAHPGQAVAFPIDAMSEEHPDVATLASAVEHHFGVGGTGTPVPDLVVVAVSGIDATVSYHETTPFEELIPQIVGALEDVVERFGELGVDVVLLPAAGISDPVYDRFQGFMESLAAEAAGEEFPVGTRPRRADARIDQLNAAIAEAGLPLLFPAYTSIDGDGDGTPDPRFFTDYTTESWPPDDGVHPNPLGQEAIAREIAAALAALVVDR